ncbi:MAG: hypothetical protein PWP65_47 [Clostridia bacterium]|nr:hypothetical protein [Clostridia bacterium]
MYYKSKKLLGMPVINLSDGHQLGRIKKLIIEPQKLNIAGFILDRKGWFKEQPVIPYSQVKNVGNHAVTVDQAGAVVKLSAMPELESLAKNPLPLMGAKVITEEGTILGVVEEFHFDPKTGHIHYLGLRGGFLQGSSVLDTSAILACGRDAIIARAGAEELVQRPQNFFSKTWCGVGEEVAKTWEYGRRLINNLSQTWQKRIPVSKNQKPPAHEEKED